MQTKSPYRDLFIYYIEGHPEADTTDFGKDFIGNWQEDGFSFLFFSNPADEKIKELITGQPHLSLLDQYNMTYDEWQGGELSPRTIGDFIIVPPWEAYRVTTENLFKKKIVLDPGVVFGSGMHPTTHDCLEAIQRLCYTEKIEDVIDIGTGTGLLAIAAVCMGCKRVFAVDLNFLAAKTARRNVLLNQMENNILVIQGRAEELVDKPADLVIANIHYDVMNRFINTETFTASKYFILSGLLRSQARNIDEMLGRLPGTVFEKLEHNNIWNTFYGRIESERI
jgi:ribosomal protein L11 methyltransferase